MEVAALTTLTGLTPGRTTDSLEHGVSGTSAILGPDAATQDMQVLILDSDSG